MLKIIVNFSAGFFAALAIIILAPGAAEATPEFAYKTDSPCLRCHANPEGGVLNAVGEKFEADNYSFIDDGAVSRTSRIIRLLVGYLHILVAFIWFGAILYIHLFIKPKQYAGGLPRGELILGWTSIILITLTGAYLSHGRFKSHAELLNTTFGIIWTIKVSAFLMMVAIATLVTTVINFKMRALSRAKTAAVAEEQKTNCFIYEGNCYDISENKLWKNGVHMGRHYVGEDLTEAISGAPHGAEVLERVKKIGPAGASAKAHPVRPMKIFVFFAYFILLLIGTILFCLAYWRWGPPLV